MILSRNDLIRDTPLLELFPDPGTSLNIRVGIGALMETLADSDVMHRHIDDLGKFTRHSDSQVRIDACHYLSLTGLQAARQYIQALLEDEDAQVKEVAQESLDSLAD